MLLGLFLHPQSMCYSFGNMRKKSSRRQLYFFFLIFFSLPLPVVLTQKFLTAFAELA